MARTKDPSKELKDQRIPVMFTASELQAIDDWSFSNRIRSRGEAIRRLCQAGVAANKSLPQVGRDLLDFADAFDNSRPGAADIDPDTAELDVSMSFNKLWHSFAELLGKMKHLSKTQDMEAVMSAIATLSDHADAAATNIAEELSILRKSATKPDDKN